MIVQIKEEFELTQDDIASCSTAPSSPPCQDATYNANSSGTCASFDSLSRKRNGCDIKEESSEENIEPPNKRFCGNQ